MPNYIKRDELYHHGILGMRWGIRRFQNPDGSLTPEGRARYAKNRVFISGTSKSQDESSEFYRKELPTGVKRKIDGYIRDGKRILVGDAPGIDRQVQDYLKKKHYQNVEIYSPGDEARYLADKRWQNVKVDVPGAEKGSKEWLAGKDEAMRREATEGLAVVIPDGASATRKNVYALLDDYKNVDVFQINEKSKDGIKERPLTRTEILADRLVYKALNEVQNKKDRVDFQVYLLKRATDPNPEDLDAHLYNEISRLVEKNYGDWYWSELKNKEAEKINRKINSLKDKTHKLSWNNPSDREQIRKLQAEIEKYQDQEDGLALEDIGFENTPELRKLMRDIRIWD